MEKRKEKQTNREKKLFTAYIDVACQIFNGQMQRKLHLQGMSRLRTPYPARSNY